MLDTIKSIGIGATGIVGSSVSASVVDNIALPINDWASALTQIVIAIVTVFSLFKKKR